MNWRRIGFKGPSPGRRGTHRGLLSSLHIEQGTILEDEGIDIGVVTHGQGLKWLQVTLTGRESHTGSTPMPKRRNAGLGMARVTELVHEVAMDYQPDAVARSATWRSTEFAQHHRRADRLHDRHPLAGQADAGRNGCADPRRGGPICEALAISFEIEQVGHFDPVAFDEGCVKAVRDAAERLGFSHRNIVSGAGHDACWINRVAPTAMIFCPCVDGLSHNEDEKIFPEWAEAGANVLFHAVVETAEIVA
jgi:N-carbamoyl-L-amino-acid hydrolase